MTLTDTQSKLLHTAAQHPEHLLTEFPANLKGGARVKVLTALTNAGWIAPQADIAKGSTLFRITAAGLQALGLPAPQPTTPTPATREGTKQATLIALLRRPEGATLGQMVSATGWQSHTVRGALSGALRKKLGLTIFSAKATGTERTYRIA